MFYWLANTPMRHSNVTQCAQLKDITLTTQCFIFALFSFAVITTYILYYIPVNQIIISAYN